MSEEEQDADVISLFDVATTLLRNRWRLVRWAFIGAVVAALWVFTRPPLYLASASFVPGNDASRPGLSALAGQFGVTLQGSNQSFSPDFYAELLKSRELLNRVARDTFAVQELRGQRVAVTDLFEIPEGSAKTRAERGVKRLGEIVVVTVFKATGVVDVSVATKWPSVSLAIVTELMNGVNDFNLHTRQGQAAAERRFVEGRLRIATADLRAAEDRLERFLATNRQFSNSPELTFQRDRLQREVSFQQQVYTALTQSYEDSRMREVRDTPLITVFESPSVPTKPESRGRARGLIVGFVLGGFMAMIWVLGAESLRKRRREAGAAAQRFDEAFRDVREEVRRLPRRITSRPKKSTP